MPRVGIICDATEEQLTFEKCRKCALRGRMACGRNPGIILSTLDAVEGYKSTERDKPSLSVTDLTSICKRQTILKEKYDYWEKPSKMNYLWRGGIVHRLLEEVENKNWMKERKFVIPFTIKLNGEDVEVYIVGKPDVIDFVNMIIYDYKTTGSVFKSTRTISQGYKYQLGIYRWITKNSDLDLLAKDLYDVFIDMKQDQQHRIQAITFEEIEKYIQKNCAILLDGRLNDKIPPVLSKHPYYWMCLDYCPLLSTCSKLHSEEKR